MKLQVEEWPIERLVPYVKNPRKNDAAVERMAKNITEFGFRIPVIACSDGSVVDGHLRLKAAHFLGIKSVPVALADDLTPAQIKALRISINQSASWADWDVGLLSEELSDLQTEDFDLGLTGFTDSELEDVMAFSDLDMTQALEEGIPSEGMYHGQARVKITIGPDCVAVFEEAIAKTGVNNRADALKIICEAYLEKR